MTPPSQLPSPNTGEPVLVLVWDLPVRVVHWLIVLLVTFSWMTAEKGWLHWHAYSGYAVLSLTLFRIYWGLCGSTTARFSHFLRGPKAVARYVRTLGTSHRQHAYFGHNPLGAWNVVALIFMLLVQAGLGLFAVDVDGLESGPLARHVEFAAGRRLAALHVTAFNILLLLIGLHIVAIFGHLLYYRENLIVPMLTGVKRVPGAQVQMLGFTAPWRAVIGLAISILLILALAIWL